MHSIRKHLLIGLFSASSLFFISCTSNEIGDSKDVAQDKIFQEYNVSYSENDRKLSATAVFRFAGPNGTTLVLNEPAGVELDGEKIKVDSSEFRGAYYEVEKIPSKWFGKHEWKFTDINNKTYTNEFFFDEFKWDSPPATVPKNRPLTIHFITSILGPDDYVEVSTVDTDSSFTCTQKQLPGQTFAVTIPVEYLQKQKQSIIRLEAVRVQKIQLQKSTTEGGAFFIRYTLKPTQLKLR